MYKRKYNKGFTLIELLVVIAIISLLSSVVLASLKSAKDKADIAKMQQEVKQFKRAMETYRTINNSYPPINPRSIYLYNLADQNYLGGTAFREALLPYIDINKLSILKTIDSYIDPPDYYGYTCQGTTPSADGYLVTFSDTRIKNEFKKWYDDTGVPVFGVYCFIND